MWRTWLALHIVAIRKASKSCGSAIYHPRCGLRQPNDLVVDANARRPPRPTSDLAGRDRARARPSRSERRRQDELGYGGSSDGRRATARSSDDGARPTPRRAERLGRAAPSLLDPAGPSRARVLDPPRLTP